MKTSVITALLTSALLSASLMSQQVLADERYISVSGEGEVQAMPDYLQLNLTISDSGADAGETAKSVNKAVQQVINIATKKGVKKDDIDAARANRQPLWDWTKDGRQYKGEQISRPVTITLRDLDTYSALLSQLMKVDHLSLQGTALRFNDPAALQEQAMTLALKNARSKARSMAAALDANVGEVLRIEENGSGPAPVFEMRAMAMAKSVPEEAPMLIQKQTISASAQVQFELK